MSSKLLLDKYPLVIIPELAEAIGLNEAIVLQQIHYWVVHNTKVKRNFQDDHYWTYNSLVEWQTQFKFWSLRTVRRTLTSLEKSGLLISGNFNKMKQDRTKWYRVDYERLDEVIKLSLLDRPCGQNGHMQVAKVDTPLPETTNRDKHTINHSTNPFPSEKDAIPSEIASPKHVKVKVVREKVSEPVGV